MSFPRGKSFLKQMLFHNQYTKSALDLMLGGQKKLLEGGGESTMDDAIVQRPGDAKTRRLSLKV